MPQISLLNFLIAVLIALTFGLAKLIYVYFLRNPLDLTKFGKWAVVTGSTDGIGAAYATELALRGFNLVLISRSPSKLKYSSEFFRSRFKVDTKILVIDFKIKSFEEMKKEVSEAIKDLDVGILINNAGVGYDYPEYFHELPEGKVEELIKVNINSVASLTSAVLPGMLQRKRGAIVNISSSSGFFPNGLLTVYSATKSFVDFFSRGLAQEYDTSGIHIQCVLPLYVTTKLSKLRHPSFFVPTPATFAKQAVRLIGFEKRITGCFSHSLQIALTNFVPSCLLHKYLFRLHSSVRRAALRKKALQRKSQP
ncbi:very-long-chain 3-oxoacyl-CoA reductase-A-like [Zophobas morio]|jgi:17beta-estradiol 17-dehydrogenase / very-long-chain 3-oxoacyl-CoA reductase|uniref:very-long-chain 3-oxoacyl-CoA reductase-A-like n=1 Tax=Zophobas morio TaxID=2755281 RepID=UPI0030838479